MTISNDDETAFYVSTGHDKM